MAKKKAIKAYKGFDNDLKCRDFQYEIGKTYTLPEGEKIKMCCNGFHAIAPDETPLRVFDYYPPCDENGNPARYCVVEVGGETDSNDAKIVGSELTVGAEIGIPGLVKAHIEWVKRHLIDDDEHKFHNTGNRSSASNTGYFSSASNTGDRSSASNTGDRSSASNTGYFSSASNTGNFSSASNTGNFSSASNTGDFSSASNTGDRSSASNTGDRSSASNTGNRSSASNTGNRSSASNTGDRSSASNTGYFSSASNTGDRSSASNTGYFSSASNTGDRSSASNTGNFSSASNTGDFSSASNTGCRSSASVSGKESVAIVTGRDSKAKGEIGCWLVLTERDEDWNILGMQCVKVDGDTIKADTWYHLVDGEVKEAVTRIA